MITKEQQFNIKTELDSKVRQQWLNMTKVEIICDLCDGVPHPPLSHGFKIIQTDR